MHLNDFYEFKLIRTNLVRFVSIYDKNSRVSLFPKLSYTVKNVRLPISVLKQHLCKISYFLLIPCLVSIQISYVEKHNLATYTQQCT